MADNKPVFHHLNNSQSQRILWLLEELEIPYDLVLHVRNSADDPKGPYLAPPSLKATGPYGKAPVLFTGSADGNRYIPETSAIATYLIRTFDKTDKFGMKNGDWIREEVLLSLCQTMLGMATFSMMMLDLGLMRTGDETKMPAAAARRFDGPAIRQALGALEQELKNGPPSGYFMGAHPGRADIMLEYPIGSARTRKYVNMEKEFPELNNWLERIYARPAWKRSLEKGNGYDMSTFPMRPRM